MKTKVNSNKPVIGISANIETIDREPFWGQELSSLNQNYIKAVIRAGGIPVLLPVIQDKEMIRAQVSLIDGLLLSGGYDVQPLLYGEEPHPDLGRINPERDFFEMTALSIAYEQGKAILGICRGLQVINVAFGGTLCQDIALLAPKEKIKHSQQSLMYVPTHTVDLMPDTLLRDIFGKDVIGTNSFHHQAIKKIAPGFVVSAKARDGVIEGFEKTDYPFLLGVQWHPERMVEHDADMLNLFRVFVSKAKEPLDVLA